MRMAKEEEGKDGTDCPYTQQKVTDVSKRGSGRALVKERGYAMQWIVVCRHE